MLQKNWDECIQSSVSFDVSLQSKSNPRVQSSLTCAFRVIELDSKTSINGSRENGGQRISQRYILDSAGSACFKKECGNTSICDQ